MRNALSDSKTLHFELTDVTKKWSVWLVEVNYLSHEVQR